ncbi:hypothetical protein [Bosea sp. Root381]|uniref:hypothetical protein n=1 Tax=Bosea sp. Root381 TaxID=1736524 RepID=UPI0012E345A0|nr:hypothetical protein [Bosea sp. Root381]
MTDLDQIIAAGTLLIIETGEYSDQRWSGPVRVLRDVKRSYLAEHYRFSWKPQAERPWVDGPDPDGFLPWLVSAGHAEDVENVQAWHVGNYSEFEP